MNWRRKLARRALERQLAYQQHKAEHLRGRENDVIVAMTKSSQRLRELLESFQPIAKSARVIEVGSGAHGLIFCFGTERGVGVDPLAVDYRDLFPGWQRRASTVAAVGESRAFIRVGGRWGCATRSPRLPITRLILRSVRRVSCFRTCRSKF